MEKRSNIAVESAELDELDLRLLEALQRNARSTFAELGALVGLKPPAVHDRVKRLAADETPRKLDEARTALDDLTRVTDGGMEELAALPNLQTLWLWNARVTDAGLKELGRIKSLRDLNLRGTKVTDAGLKELAELQRLQQLLLQETGITDAGLKELAALKGLKTVYLYATKVTASGIAELKKALPECNVTQVEVE